MNIAQSNQITISFYYSVLYYGIKVWHHRHLGVPLETKSEVSTLQSITGDLWQEENEGGIGQDK